jgi:RNA polymerase sigma-70 factor (ECF subfamily)
VDAVVMRQQGDRPAADAKVTVSAVRRVATNADLVEAAYQRHYRDVYRYVLALTRSMMEAEEVTSEVFERALRTWRREPDRAQAWLLLTARRIATDRFRRARRLLTLPAATPPIRAPEGEATEFWVWFEAVCRALTDRQREALVLRYQRDLTDADIARILGLTESGVRSLISRALQVLRDHPELL